MITYLYSDLHLEARQKFPHETVTPGSRLQDISRQENRSLKCSKIRQFSYTVVENIYMTLSWKI